MKNLLLYLIVGLLLIPSFGYADVWVNGYYRSDGTYVEGHYRSDSGGIRLDNTKIPNATGINAQLKSIKEAQDQLKKDQESQKKELEANLLRSKLDSISNQLRQINQNSTQTCAYPPYYSSCTDRERQQILTDWESAKSWARSQAFSRGIVGTSAEQELIDSVNNEYSGKLSVCQNAIDANKRLVDLYEQCKLEERNYQSEKIRREQELLQEKTNNEMYLRKLDTCLATYGGNIKFSSNYDCSCADGYQLVGGICTNYNEIDLICKKVLGENSIVGSISNGLASCGCKGGYIIDKSNRCEIISKTIETSTQINNDSIKKPILPSKKEIESVNLRDSKPNIATTSEAVESGGDDETEATTRTQPISVVGKFFNWVKSLSNLFR